jgi:hypothetical protein
MKHKQILPALTGLLFLLAGCTQIAEPTYTIILDKLDEPRGLWLAADGALCVAEAGGLAAGQTLGAEQPTTAHAETGALTCLEANGQRRRLVEHLPYVLYSASGVSVGPTDVAEMDGALYLLTGEGYGELSRTLLRLEPGKSPHIVANFLKFAAAGKPLEYIQPASIAVNPYALIPDPANHRFLVSDGASGQVLAAGLDGKIEVYSPVEGHEVLTGLAWGPDGLPYVASFSQLPHQAGAGAILRLQPNGTAEVVLDNLTTPIDLAFDKAGRLYVLEFIFADTSGDPYREKTGRLLRFTRQGDGWTAAQVLVEKLPYPTALLFGPDERLYISLHGAFSPAQSGVVARFDNLVSQRQGQAPLQYRP